MNKETFHDDGSFTAEMRRIQREVLARSVRLWINRAIWAVAGALLVLAGYLFSK